MTTTTKVVIGAAVLLVAWGIYKSSRASAQAVVGATPDEQEAVDAGAGPYPRGQLTLGEGTVTPSRDNTVIGAARGGVQYVLNTFGQVVGTRE